VVEFLKTLQVLRPRTQALVVDEHGAPKRWPLAGVDLPFGLLRRIRKILC